MGFLSPIPGAVDGWPARVWKNPVGAEAHPGESRQTLQHLGDRCCSFPNESKQLEVQVRGGFLNWAGCNLQQNILAFSLVAAIFLCISSSEKDGAF